jgi:hypothetical protein
MLLLGAEGAAEVRPFNEVNLELRLWLLTIEPNDRRTGRASLRREYEWMRFSNERVAETRPS